MGPSKTYIFLITIHVIYVVTAQEVVRRVPQGFLGMRGKKYYELGDNDINKRKPHFFVGVKGKKDYDMSSETDLKRAPMGFMGMRGKKEYVYPDFMLYPENYEYVPKRSGSLIGQIDYSAEEINGNSQEYPMLNDVINQYLEKLRAGEVSSETNDADDVVSNEVEKRANLHSFFGVRGKKSIQDKRPYDLSFRGKFIGVRGKKDVKNSGAQEIRFLLNGPWSKRRSQTGFLGVRGKKWVNDENTLESEPANRDMSTPN